MSNLVRDLRLAVRRLSRARGFAITIVGTLALGIGVATAVLTVANALLLRQLPIADQNRVVVLDVPLGHDEAREFARTTSLLRSAALLNYEGAAPVTIREGERLTRLRRSLVTGDFFSVLGAQPLLGRTLRAEDDASGAAPVVVISHKAWQSQFGGADDVIGRKITTHEDGLTSTIVGVMQPGLDYPHGVDAWIPVRAVVASANLNFLGFDIVGRLSPTSTVSGAKDALVSFLQRPGTSEAQRKRQATAVALPDAILGNTRPAVIAFAAASALLLLITCLNVANLFLVRGLARSRDVALRRALGATPGRIVSELITEHTVLVLLGGTFGVVVATFAVRAFLALAPAGLPRLAEVRVDGALLLGAFACTAIAGFFAAVGPALWAARSDERLGVGTPGAVNASHGRTWMLREVLVGLQVALALLVLSAAGLLGKSLWKLERVDLSFDPSRMVVAQLALPAGRYDQRDAQVSLFDRIQPALAAIPGVQAASPVVSVPYAELTGWRGKPSAERQTELQVADNPTVDLEVVSPTFFTTLGLPLSSGRAFTDADRAGAPEAVVLSESAARRFWPTGSAVGKRVRLSASRPWLTVVGVVPDTRYRDLREPRPTMYFPLRQSPFPFAPPTIVVRTTRAPGDLASAIRIALGDVAPDVVLARVESYETLLTGPLAQPRMNAVLLAVFAAAAVGLSAIGMLGIFATTLRLRRREFGIRMALGATAANVATLVVRRGLVVTVVGVALGLAGALATNRLLSSLLFEVSPVDAFTLGGAVVLVIVVAAMSALFPTRASTKIPPASALRGE